MRALCGVPAVPPACGGPGGACGAPLPASARFLTLRVPPSPGATHAHAQLCVLVDARARLRDARAHALRHLYHSGVREPDIFGVAVLYDGDYLFPELESKLSKYAPKSWRSSHTHGLDGNGRPLLELHLRVQFPAARASHVRDEGARRLWARQLAGEAAQLGGAGGRLVQALREDQDTERAELRFLREACALPHLAAHCYRLRAAKREPPPGSVRLYIRAAGLSLAPDSRPPAFFPWASIGRLSFDRKKFEIRAGESRITLYSSSGEKSRLLLALCRDTHHFSMRSSAPTFCSAGSNASSNTTSGIASDPAASEDEPDAPSGTPPAEPEPEVEGESESVPTASDTSGVYTMASSAAPQTLGDSLYGGGDTEDGDEDQDQDVDAEADGGFLSGDSVDGFRPRGDSGASAAGSFRGDGSDPTDRLHGPLSAEELSDLIVGRNPAPDPPDSESDYVTLPRPDYPFRPPTPPERGDSARPPDPPPPPRGSLRDLRLGIPLRPARASPARFPPPPPPLTVYTSRLARTQIEQYRRQLCSDADFVVYPMQDPAVSRQDYLDSKLAACARGGLCRSTQALSDTYVRLPPCAAIPRRRPPPPPFPRAVSQDSIPDSLGARRLPPPPPPPYPRRPPAPPAPPTSYPPPLPEPPAGPIDIKTLREKSKNLDLPLIAALCNDRSLLKQTEAFVMPRHGDHGGGGRRVPSSGKGPGSKSVLGSAKPARRGCHRHPGDALPALPLPSPRATANTYVPDPRSSAVA